ncbi:MAG: flagellar assembly protein FliH [Porticoccus sp.]
MSDLPQIETILEDSDRWRPWAMDELSSTTNKVTDSDKTKSTAQNRAQKSVDTDISKDPAYEEAKQAGYKAGMREGRNDGHKKGFETGKKEGYSQGLEEGLEEGRKEAATELNNQLSTTLAPLSLLVSHFEEAIALLDSTISAELVELALAIGCQLARERLDVEPELMLDIVRDLLHMDPSLDSKPRLWLHPEDLSLVQQQLGDELEAAGWKLQPDKHMSRGGCKLTSANEECDATWETRCQAILAQVRHRRISGMDSDWEDPQ